MKYASLFLLVLAFLLTGCVTENRRNYILLVDNSFSVTEEVRQSYFAIIANSIVQRLGSKDKLTVLLVDEGGYARAERIYQVDLAEHNFTDSRDGLNNAGDSIRARRTRFINSNLSQQLALALARKTAERKHLAGFTDILGTLKSSASLLERAKDEPKGMDYLAQLITGSTVYRYSNVIIICSDMINESPTHTYDFCNIQTWNDSVILAKTATLSAKRLLPNFFGARVLVHGATGNAVNPRDRELQAEKVQTFWETYFIHANAQLVAYGYDTRAEIENLMAGDDN